jgi:hypothetical protein
MFRKFFRSIAVNGVKETVRIINNKMSSAPNIDEPNLIVKTSDVLKADYIRHPYVAPPKIRTDKLDIAFIVPPFGIGGGGHTTITRVAKYLQSRGHKITFYVYDIYDRQTAEQAHNMLTKYYDFSSAGTAELRNFSKLHNTAIATSWETAYALFNIKAKVHKFYLVQDFEPMFFGVGSRYALAESTYKFGFYGITAGEWLKKRVDDYGMKADSFGLGVDLDVYKPKNPIKKKQQICFYARSSTERRGFELGVMSLEIFHKLHPKYKIVLFGQNEINRRLDFPYVNAGILSQEKLAKLYQESAACLVLSLTNASLLPFELLAAGCAVVINGGDNNTMMFGKNHPGIFYSDLSPISLAGELELAVKSSSNANYTKSLSDSVSGNGWNKPYRKFEQILMREATL